MKAGGGRFFLPVLVGILLVTATISSLGAPLLSTLASDLGVSLSSIQWSLTAPILTSVVSAPVIGRLGDGRYRREGVIGALVVVCAGSVIAAVSDSLPWLIVGRAMQGVGLGLTPIVIAAARDHLPPDRAPAAIGLLSVTAASGVGAGYPISGLIASQFDVEYLFLLGAVLSGLALVSALLVVPSTRDAEPMRVDLRGAALGSVGIVALILGISEGGHLGWDSPLVLGSLVGSVFVLTAWVRLQLRSPMPLIDLRQLRHREVRAADLLAVLIGVTLYVYLTVVSEFVQTPTGVGFGFGASTFVAGLCFVPFSVGSLAASRFVVPLTRRLGITLLLCGGTLVIAAAGGFLALSHSSLWHFLVGMLIIGVGFGLTFGAIPNLVAESVPRTEVGSAIGFYQVARSTGHSIGSAAVASILAASEVASGAFPSESGYIVALLVGAGACLAGVLVVVALSRRRQPLPAGAGA